MKYCRVVSCAHSGRMLNSYQYDGLRVEWRKVAAYSKMVNKST